MVIYNSRGRLAKYLDPSLQSTKDLLKQGVTIVDVCTPERAKELVSSVWDMLESLGTGIDRANPTTWHTKNWPQDTHSLLQNQNMGLRICTCLARLECVDTFKWLFGGKKVNSSADAISVAKPDKQARAYKTAVRLNSKFGEGDTLVSPWLHMDQSNFKKDCALFFQGAFALTDLSEKEQRTQFIIPNPESEETIQMFRDRFLTEFPAEDELKKKSVSDAEREEWVPLAIKDGDIAKTDPLVLKKRKWLIENGQVYTPTLKAGQMVIWDSGVPHASIPGPCDEVNEHRNIRVSTFVCMIPAELVTEEERNVRDKMLDKAETSGHRSTEVGKSGKVRKCAFKETGRVYGGAFLPKFSKETVVMASKRKLKETGDSERPDSLANKTQRLCAGNGM